MQIKESVKERMRSEGMTQRQTDIICAAIELFSQKGYEATTTREIAERANVAEGSIFRYYKTKKDLLLAVPKCLTKILSSQFFLEGINEIFESSADKFEDSLRSIILNRKNFVFENMPILKVMIQEMPFHPELKDTFLGAVLPSIGNASNAIEMFKEKGQIVDIPSEIIINLIATTLFGYFFSRYAIMVNTLSWNEEEEIDYLVKYIMNGIGKHNL